jgi:diguanylate cyclase (GGDEF)-like protein
MNLCNGSNSAVLKAETMPNGQSQFRLRLKVWLLLLSMLPALPIVGFAGFAVHQVADYWHEKVLADLEQEADILAAATEHHLGSIATMLATLAQSNAAQDNDLPALYNFARRLLPFNPDALAITLIGPEGRQIFNTLQPFGKILPPTGDLAGARQVFETARPLVSGLFTGTVSNQPVISVGVPVILGGQVVYCLRIVILARNFAGILAPQRLQGDWIGVIADGSGTIIARSRSPETTVGTKVSPTLQQAIARGRRGTFEGMTKEGIEVQTRFRRLEGTDWVVAMAVTRSALEAPGRKAMTLLAYGGILFLVVSVTLALALSRLLSRQVSGMVAAVVALGHGHETELPATHIHELHVAGAAVDAVRAREQGARLALADAMVENQQVKAELSQARLDPLTGLANRGLFLELAEAMRAGCADDPLQVMAVLLIDLDGFKAVNDLFGHARGDEVLVAAATILRHASRTADIIGRLGGDEFAVGLMAPAGSIDAVAQAIAGRIIEQMATIGDGIGCSIGIARRPEHCSDLSCVLRQADAAMYEAKRTGKNRHVRYGAPRADGGPWEEPASGGCACRAGRAGGS